MNGIPKLDALRSISLYGLSSLTMNFEFDTDPYFARAQAFQRISDAEVPDGVTPSMSPLFSPSGLIYRYVLQSPIDPPRTSRSSRSGCSNGSTGPSRESQTIPGWADRQWSTRSSSIPTSWPRTA